MSDQEHIKDVLENAERFQRLFVQPMVDAVRAEVQASLKPLAEKQTEHESRVAAAELEIQNLKSNQKRALLGWGVLSLGVATAVSAGWQYFKDHVGISR